MIVEHNADSMEEVKAITEFIDFTFGIEYEVTEMDIIVFDMEPEEFDELMIFLKNRRYVR